MSVFIIVRSSGCITTFDLFLFLFCFGFGLELGTLFRAPKFCTSYRDLVQNLVFFFCFSCHHIKSAVLQILFLNDRIGPLIIYYFLTVVFFTVICNLASVLKYVK